MKAESTKNKNAQSVAHRIEALLRASLGDVTPSDALLDKYGFAREFATRDRVKRRGFTRKRQLRIFMRDGFLDRYTGERLVFPGALLLLGELYPTAFPKPKHGAGWRVGQCHWIYWRLWPTVDHVEAVAKGGSSDDEEKLVTTCQMINSAKSAWDPEEVPEEIRLLLREGLTPDPAVWDGMLTWFVEAIRSSPSLLGRDSGIDKWYIAAEKALANKVRPGDTVKITRSKKRNSVLDLDNFFLDPTGTYEAPDEELFSVFSGAGYEPSDLPDKELSARYARWLAARRP